MGVEVAHDYCIGKGVEEIKLELEVRGCGRGWWDVDVCEVDLLFVQLDTCGLYF